MTSKTKFFSWSKSRQSVQPSEPYHRTGGLLAIDTSVGDVGNIPYLVVGDAKGTPGPGRRRPPNLYLTIPPELNKHHYGCLTPASARHNAALVNSASNLLAVVNDMLRSPALSATVCPRSAEIHKPLPSRPRSVSLPSTPVLPAELPGSLLLENQGLPSPPVAGSATDTMRSVRSGNPSPSAATAAAKPSASKLPQHKKSSSEIGLQRRSKSRPNLVKSPSSTDSKLTTCSTSSNGGQTSGSDAPKPKVGADSSLEPSPVIIEGQAWEKGGALVSSRRDELPSPDTPTPTPTRSKQVDELKSTITAQDNTISTLQTQFGSLRATHEAHVASLIDAHAAEVASLKNYTRVLEEQQSQRTLHHASSNHLLLLLDTTDPQTPGREQSPYNTAESATSIRSFKSALEHQVRSPAQARDSPEMENLRRKLSAARRPDIGNRDIRELNHYKQNNAALQKQIESLMAKLNESKKNERSLSTTLEEVEKKCTEWQEKARKAEQLRKSGLALQNTIDHLEHRLEMANCEKLDAEEQLFNLQSQRSPFDANPPKLQTALLPKSAHTSMSTVFSSGAGGSPTSHHNESQPPATISALVSHIERLQEQIKSKDHRITELEQKDDMLQAQYQQLNRDYRELNLQSDIQGQLLQKTKNTDVHIDQLRTVIIEREATIGEKEKALRMAERQLEHHKLLLQAEIRRHATLSLYANSQDAMLPDLTTLASKDDIDRWLERLRNRLKKDKSKKAMVDAAKETGSVADDLRKEIEFYVREIIYYKLDIKGYKSDIKKLKHLATRMGSYGSRTFGAESPSPSLALSADTPVRARFSNGTSGLGISASPSPVSTGPISATLSIGRPATPPAGLLTPDPTPTETSKPLPVPHKRRAHELRITTSIIPQTPPREAGTNLANEADNVDPGISPRSVARLSPERRKPTPPSPDQERFGELATNFPLSTPAAPKRHDTQRSNSDSIIQLYAAPRTPEWSPPLNPTQTTRNEPQIKTVAVTRETLAYQPSNGKSTPERPPRPRYGLYESPQAPITRGVEGIPTPPCVDVLAEAMRNSPDRGKHEPEHARGQKLSTPLSFTHAEFTPPLQAPRVRGLSTTNLSRSGSAGSDSAIPAPLSVRERAGSAGSSTTAIPRPFSPQRKGSTGSGSSVPFVIGIGSPHNPALIAPTTVVSPNPCPITGKSTTKASLKVQRSTSRSGLGGTMASSTPLSPASPIDATKSDLFGRVLPVAANDSPSSKPASSTHSRKPNSMSGLAKVRSGTDPVPRSSGHSRNASASSILSAIQLPGSLMKGKGKARKESISHPTPLASPFDLDRTMTDQADAVGHAL